MLPVMIGITVLLPIPFIIAERLRPARPAAPRWTGYVMNYAIAILTTILAAPIGMVAGLATQALHTALDWAPFEIPFDQIAAIPIIGPLLKVLLLALAPLILHDLWFYWSHRLEHRTPLLWAFHSLHHSDPEMNCTTWARDHFLQSGWRAFFPTFTLGLIIELSYREAGLAAMLSTFAFMLWSMFYHSAIRVELPWLDRVLVTPQVHRIHHSVDAAHHDRNFADLFPFLDILFGTYVKPARGEFTGTGLDDAFLVPSNPIGAQFNPLLRALRIK
jgi:sterol desaturase/sphingolipid hydroxylase (fatty acid hydroxylase superfamily)